MTVLEVIQRSSEFLGQKGVESPRLQVELLLAHVLKMPRMKLYLNFDRVLSGAELEVLRGLVKRRGTREPLQHILGSAPFCSHDFTVNGDVLIPRPETELLVEAACEFLESRPAAAVFDFGTGSGCLAITLALKFPQTSVRAVDVSEAALRVARGNARQLGVETRVDFLHGDGFAVLETGAKFDLVVSNPPYIPSAEIAELDPEVRDHDPRLALDGGADGLEFYKRLAAETGVRLNTGGRLMLELGFGQAAAVGGLLGEYGWTVAAVRKDYSGCDRILIAHRGD